MAPWARGSSKTIVLGQEILKEVWADMATTTLPSWMTRPPCNLGSPGHGELRADQWRSACLVHLVITLVCLWGHFHVGSQEKSMLDNYIALVIAVWWATRRSTSDDHVEIVNSYLHYYLTSLVKLYTTEALQPSHHLSLHLSQCIQLFGPVHGWWSFPFEHFNGIIQQYHTNNKIGELELTFMKAFCQGGNLHALLQHQSGFPQVLDALKPLIHKHYGDTVFNSTLTSDLATLAKPANPLVPETGGLDHPKTLPNDIYELLLA
ncbi:hypothetical protein F5J12DRAFT_728555 [Pisolithus orientalis]|uniref:uncharacterized protein n=1 Tax=Pisolithus orientalis TaxID=936130 RepID=UPI002224766F|nr:uncharacterized protein F5J12DRAFT_728555 [Pisolithus orientalis]KAI5987311.1 hypothetical protein F5J12DRAFT_728555 [Pisolithus orientalis]